MEFRRRRRVASTIGNATFVAGFLVMLMPLAIVQLARARTAASRVAYGLVVASLLACIMFTEGRGAVIAMALSLIVLGLLVALASRRNFKPTVIIVAAVMMVMAAAAIPISSSTNGLDEETRQSRLSRLLDTETGSGHIRLLFWEGVESLVESNPLRMAVGYGPETVKLTLPAHLPAEIDRLNRGAVSDRAHNDVFDILLTTGLLGLLGWILVITGLALGSLSTLGIVPKGVDRLRFLFAWFGFGFAALLAVRFLDGSWRLGGLAFAAGLVGGLLAYLAASVLTARPQPVSRDRLLLAAVVTSIIAHFLDVQIGVATVATRSYFWIFAGVSVAIGIGLEPSNSSKSRPSFDASILLVGWVLATIASGLVITTRDLGNVWVGLVIAGLTWFLAQQYRWGAAAVAGSYVLLRWLGIRGGFESTVVPVLYLLAAIALIVSIAFLLISAEDRRVASWNRRFGVAYIVLVGVLAYATLATMNSIRADVRLRDSTFLMSVGEPARSLRAAEEAVRLDPERSMYHLNLGKAYVRTGEFARAEAALLKAQSLSPLDSDHPANLGRLFQHWWQSDRSGPDAEHRVERALVHFNRATYLSPNNPSIWNELALTQLIAGDTTASLSTLRHSADLDDEVAHTHIQMGNVYRSIGKLNQALASYKRALTLDINEDVQSALEQVVDQIESE